MAFDRVLLPVEFKVRDEGTLAYACGLAAQGVRKLTVVHVVGEGGLEAPVLIAEVERARQRLRTMVEPYRGRGPEIEVRVLTGTIYDQVLATASETGTDVILCGTEGKSFVDYLFSGSVSEDIALSGDLRTMAVRYDLIGSTAEAEDLGHDFARTLVVPTDFSEPARHALCSALDRPAEALGTLHLLHVIEPGADWTETECALSTLVDEVLAGTGVNYVTAIRQGEAPAEVLAYLAEVEATGCITGREGRSRLSRSILGSVSVKLLQEAPCPVVIQP